MSNIITFECTVINAFLSFPGRFYEMKVFVSTLFLVILSCNAQGEEPSLKATQERDSKCK